LAERGHEVHMVSSEQPFRLEKPRRNLLFHAIEQSEYPLFRHPHYTMNTANKLISLVEDFGVEIIHSHYAIPHAAAAWQAQTVLRDCSRPTGKGYADVKLACTLHGTDITLIGRERSYYEMTRFSINRQDLLTTPSKWLAEETEKHFHIAPGRILAIPNFVDTERFKPDPAQAWRESLAAPDARVITHVSNFRPVKRIEEVIRAFSIIRKRMKASLVLVGEGPDLPKAEMLARELGIRNDLRLLGNQRPEPILQASDLFLLPSVAESFGLAALEAMACGCPVLGYHAGGLPEVVIDGVTGILCEIGKDVCLGTKAAELLEDAPRLAAMRIAARVQAERFAPAAIVDQYEQALLKTLGK